MGFFDSFVKRVMEAAKLGRLDKTDVSKLKRMFDNTKKRNIVLAKGILSALKAGKTSDEDTRKFAKLLENANTRIENEKAPFSAADEKELRQIFTNAGISEKAARWFSLQMDEFLGTELEESVMDKKTIEYPKQKKTIKYEFPQKKQKIEG